MRRHDHEAVFVSDCPGCIWDQQSVLLRDTPEDRERLRGIVRDVMNKWLGDDLAPDDEWNAEYDAIIAALREAK